MQTFGGFKKLHTSIRALDARTRTAWQGCILFDGGLSDEVCDIYMGISLRLLGHREELPKDPESHRAVCPPTFILRAKLRYDYYNDLLEVSGRHVTVRRRLWTGNSDVLGSDWEIFRRIGLGILRCWPFATVDRVYVTSITTPDDLYTLSKDQILVLYPDLIYRFDAIYMELIELKPAALFIRGFFNT